MRRIYVSMICLLLLIFSQNAAIANQDSLEKKVHDLQAMIKDMRMEYETRLNQMAIKIAKLEGENPKAVDVVSLKRELEPLLDEEGNLSEPHYTSEHPHDSKWQNFMLDISIIGDSLANVTWPERSIDEGRAGKIGRAHV